MTHLSLAVDNERRERERSAVEFLYEEIVIPCIQEVAHGRDFYDFGDHYAAGRWLTESDADAHEISHRLQRAARACMVLQPKKKASEWS